MKRFFLILLSIVHLCCLEKKDGQKQVNILPLHPYSSSGSIIRIDTKVPDSIKALYFYIENYSGYETDSTAIDAFVKNNIEKDFRKYYVYGIYIYRKDEFLNKDYKEKDLKRLQESISVISYEWSDGILQRISAYLDSRTVRLYHKHDDDIFNSTFDDTNISNPDSVKLIDVERGKEY